LRPAKDSLVASEVKTAAVCSAECSKDSDCEGETRGEKPADLRCEKGFVCGVAFEVGPLCCKKLCVCRDFVSGGLPKPASCSLPEGERTCKN
jgi:hypothetical protein